MRSDHLQRSRAANIARGDQRNFRHVTDAPLHEVGCAWRNVKVAIATFENTENGIRINRSAVAVGVVEKHHSRTFP